MPQIQFYKNNQQQFVENFQKAKQQKLENMLAMAKLQQDKLQSAEKLKSNQFMQDFINKGGKVTSGPFGGVSYDPTTIPQSPTYRPNIEKMSGGMLEETPESEGTGKGQSTVAEIGVAGEAEANQAALVDKKKKQAEISMKTAVAVAENKAQAEALVPVLQGVYADLEDAYDEIEKVAPEAMDSGLGAWAQRKGIQIGSSQFVDEFPAVAALLENLKADATTFAKAYGEQRPTDMDIERFTKLLIDPTKRGLKTNIVKMKSMVRRMEYKGAPSKWASPFIKMAEDRLSRLEAKKVKVGDVDVSIREA